MTSHQRNHIELLIDQIDAGLISLYNANEQGYNFTDFDFLIKDLLSSNQIDEYNHSVKKYLSVFSDLCQNVGVRIYQTIKVDLKNKKLTLKEIHHRSHFGDVPHLHEEKEIVQDISGNHFALYKSKKPEDYKDVRVDYTKFAYYAADSKVEDKATIHNLFFFTKEGYKAIFDTYSYNEKAPYVTFESYVKSLLNQAKSKSPRIEENLLLLESAYQKFLFIKYSGLLDSLMNLITKKDGTAHQKKIAKTIAYVTGESASNCNSYLPDLINDDKRTSNNANLYTNKNLRIVIKTLEDIGLSSEEACKKLSSIENNKKD